MLRYFISDLHLSDKRLDLIQAFVHLTDEICHSKAPCELYILGDFFEAYIGDDYQPNWVTQLDLQLQKLHQRKVTTYFIAGNRDFLVGDRWFKRNQVIELPEQSPLTIDGIKVVLTHGDEFCVDDKAYQEFRAMVRQPAWQQQVLAMPLEQRLALAQKLRDDSKSSSADKSMAIMDVNLDEISRVLPSDTDLLIHGHTHRPALHDSENIKRLVLGDWDRSIWCGVLKDNSFKHYAMDTQSYLDQVTPVSEWRAMQTVNL